MEIRNLNTFLQVATLKNFTRAGQVLKYSQSNISAQIKQLEEEVGVPLFDRIGRSITLTAYGEALLPYAQRIVSTASKIESFLKEDRVLGGRLRIGMTDSLFELLLEDVLINYHRRFPKVTLDLTLNGASELEEDLRHGILDLACIIHNPLSPTEWTVWDSMEVPIVLVANPNHPLVGKPHITPEDIAQQELILMEETGPYSQFFQEVLSSHQLSCEPFLRLKSADTARKLVERERFVSQLPLYTVQESVRQGKLCILDVPEFHHSQLIQLVFHRNKVVTPQMEGLLEELRLVLDKILAEKLN